MATEFVTAPSTPEPASEPAPPAEQDMLQIAVEQKLIRHRDGGEQLGSSSSMTIFRVPAHVRAGTNRELYEPRLVSVGPYYRGRPELRAMEQHKWRYLHELLAESPSAASASLLAGCVSAVRDVERQARRCYSEQTEVFAAGGDFAEMLLLDGCFVLQFFIKWYRQDPDRLCDVGWGLPLLLSDLLLLENQIPFFVLEALFSTVNPEATRLDLLLLFVPKIKLDESTLCDKLLAGVVPERAQVIDHLLHLLYETSLPTAAEEQQSLKASASVADSPSPASPPPLPQHDAARLLPPMWLRVKTAVGRRFAFLRDMPPVPGWRRASSSMALLREVTAWFRKLVSALIVAVVSKTRTTTTGPPPPMVVPSVTLLREAGVRFEKKASARDMFDVTFDAASGVLRMAPMKFDYATKTQLVNLVAFEQTVGDDDDDGGGGKPVSSYAALVGSLVRTAGDVEHLQKHGVVQNLLGSDGDAAAQFFQKLGDCSSLDYREEHHYLAAVFRDLDKYYRSSWKRHKAKFLREHCSSPWAMLALVIAGCAFCFALFKFSTTIYEFTHPYCHC